MPCRQSANLLMDSNFAAESKTFGEWCDATNAHSNLMKKQQNGLTWQYLCTCMSTVSVPFLHIFRSADDVFFSHGKSLKYIVVNQFRCTRIDLYASHASMYRTLHARRRCFIGSHEIGQSEESRSQTTYDRIISYSGVVWPSQRFFSGLVLLL